MKHYAVKEKKEKKKREREQTRLSFFREKYLAYIFSSFSRTIFSFFSNYRFFKKKKGKKKYNDSSKRNFYYILSWNYRENRSRFLAFVLSNNTGERGTLVRLTPLKTGLGFVLPSLASLSSSPPLFCSRIISNRHVSFDAFRLAVPATLKTFERLPGL